MEIDVKKITFTAPEVAELVTETRNIELGPTEIAGQTVATLVSPGTELNGAYLGDQPGRSFPREPGYSAVFTVEQVGSEVTDVSAGDLRFCMGKHASHQVDDVSTSLPLPDGLEPDLAIFARLMGVTMTSLVTTSARPPDTVLVAGLGPVGCLGAQNFNANGYNVIGCDPDAERRELASRLGIRETVANVSEASAAGNVALLLDCSGHEAAVVEGAKVVRKRGEVVLVGAPWSRRTELKAHDLLHTIFFNYVDIRSGWEWELPRQSDDFRYRSIFGNFETALKWLSEEKVRVAGLGMRSDPANAQDAYQALLHRKCECPTIIFDWT